MLADAGPADAAVAVAGWEDAPYSPGLMQRGPPKALLHRHLLGIKRLSQEDINYVLDLVDGYVELNRPAEKKRSLLRGPTIINSSSRARRAPAPRSRTPSEPGEGEEAASG